MRDFVQRDAPTQAPEIFGCVEAFIIKDLPKQIELEHDRGEGQTGERFKISDMSLVKANLADTFTWNTQPTQLI